MKTWYTPKKEKGYCLHGHTDIPENRNKKGNCIICDKEARLRPKGWTVEMYSATAVEQGDRCAICRKPSDRGPLCADHKEVPRGLLCHRCNTAIGLLKDSPESCRAAADYLEAWA